MRRTRSAVAVGGLAVVVGLLGLGACTSSTSGNSGSSSSASSSSSSSSSSSGAMAAPAAAAGTVQRQAATGGKTAPIRAQQIAQEAAPAGRQVIKTASVNVAVPVPTTGRGAQADTDAQAAAVSRVSQDVRALALAPGYVESSQGGGTTISITLRVAPAGYDGVFTALSGLGTVTQRTEKAEDVTGQLVDLSSRMATMKASVDRVRQLLAKATSIGDVVSLESELTSREADLESLESQQAQLSGLVALSTITVVLTSQLTGVPEPVVAAPVLPRTGFLGGLQSGWHALKGGLKAGAAVVGALLPFVPFFAIAFAVWLWIRRNRQRTLNRTGAEPVAPTVR